jgi:hypothetical protein
MSLAKAVSYISRPRLNSRHGDTTIAQFDHLEDSRIRSRPRRRFERFMNRPGAVHSCMCRIGESTPVSRDPVLISVDYPSCRHGASILTREQPYRLAALGRALHDRHRSS